MISLWEAHKIVLESDNLMGTERVDLQDCLGRVLAEDVVSDMDMPPFDKSAMDGFACRKEDLGGELEIVETIAAGQHPVNSIGKYQCARIMTGAMVPEGADCVIKVEDTRSIAGNKVIFMAKNTRSNIAIKGEDIKHGDRVLTKGTWIKPQQIAVLASVGCNRALVFKQPTVAIISTGDEIVEPWEKPGPTQIRNSNGYQLHGQVLLAGGKPKYIGIAPDKEEASFEMMDKALREYDILLLTGGVSMGHFDFIPGIIERLGATIRFKTLAVQPGKPTVFATFNKKRVFGLPGNPVSCFTIFILLVRPLILSMMGAAEKISPHALPLGESYTRKKSDRMSWIPVTVSSEGKLHPIEYHGSAHIRSLAGADAVAGIPAGVKELKTGDLLDVRFI